MTNLHADAERLHDELQDAHVIARHERDAHEPLRADLEHLAHIVEGHAEHSHAELDGLAAALAAHLALPHTLHGAAEEGSAPLTETVEELQETMEELEEAVSDLSPSSSQAAEAAHVEEAAEEAAEEVLEEVETVVQGPPPEEEERPRKAPPPRSRYFSRRRSA